MEDYLRIIELELIIHQKDYELSIKDAALAVTNKEIEEKNNTIKQLTEKLQLIHSQYYDAIMELRDKLRAKDDKIEELSTKLAEVVVGNKKHDVEVEYWKNSIDRKNDYIDELHEHIKDLDSTIEGQKEQIADLENRIDELKDRLSSTSDKEATKGPDKMPDYEGFRRAVEDMCEVKGIWETFFNE